MSPSFVVAGTDTDVGKTVFCAALMQALDANYWKPVQCGLEGGVDAKTVQNLTGLSDERFFPESYIFSQALSPHRAAELDMAQINVKSLQPPQSGKSLLIELAGGLLVPMTRKDLQIDIVEDWGLPVILCARTGLGTINHTLLSVEALKSRNIAIYGIAFIGDDNPDTVRTIADFSGVRILGRLPRISPLTPQNLQGIFSAHFKVADFQG